MVANLEHYVQRAKNGNKQALGKVVSGIQGKIYGLSLRMLGHFEDAEDEAQEILIKVITHLSDFREESAFSSWVYRIACNHLLTTRKRNSERMGITFEFLENLTSAESQNIYAPAFSGQEREILVEEARVDCLQAVLISLERKIRITFILGEVFGFTSVEGAYILEITPETFRKRLSRGREQIQAFMLKKCGLVNKNNPCQCEKNAARAQGWGLMDPEKKYFVKNKDAMQSRAMAMSHLKELSEIERITVLFHSYPEYQSPDSFTNIVKDLIDSGKYNVFM